MFDEHVRLSDRFLRHVKTGFADTSAVHVGERWRSLRQKTPPAFVGVVEQLEAWQPQGFYESEN